MDNMDIDLGTPSDDKSDKLRSNMQGRRSFLKASGSTILGAPMVFAMNFPTGLLPIGLVAEPAQQDIPGKDARLTVLNDRPINMETPPHLLDDRLTPGNLFFVRNNGIPPEVITGDVESTWKLTIGGEAAEQEMAFTLTDLKSTFTHHTYQLTLECGGNGRSEFNPPAKGNQWSTGAVGCASFTGVRLKDVLYHVGLKSSAIYIGYYGADKHLNGSDDTVISRGVPLDKALEDESLIAWAMNGQDLPPLNGYPLRLVFGGWPASCSGKWLTKIIIRDQVHDGPKMTGQSYRVPCDPVAPGSTVADEDMCIIQSMPVKSLITYPKTGGVISLEDTLPIRGHAWAGDLAVEIVDVSIDFGQTWQPCRLEKPANRLAWQHFKTSLSFPQKGYYEVWARATDSEDKSQPMILPGWNPRGYLNNACHRIAIKVT
ncbi:MAG: sulfite oxidase [Saprospiraceae bacterium]|nr:sulfite oxidase [Saprospiraceae bacterium]